MKKRNWVNGWRGVENAEEDTQIYTVALSHEGRVARSSSKIRILRRIIAHQDIKPVNCSPHYLLSLQETVQWQCWK